MINKKRPLLIQGLNPAWYSHHHTRKKTQTTISITEITENNLTKTKKTGSTSLMLDHFFVGPVHLPN